MSDDLDTGLLLELNEYRDASVNQFFLLVMGTIVFLMQTGFAFVEAGLLREKNVTNILMKNFWDACFGALIYYVCGYAFAYGEGVPPPGESALGGSFIGSTKFALVDVEPYEYSTVFFQFTFAATAATIVSGALAERADFRGYVAYSIFLTGFVYSVATHWVWAEGGFLYELGYVDYAGSGAVHAIGGMAAMCGCYLLGPRLGRFHRDRDGTIQVRAFPPHSVPFFVLGAMILFLGFLAFNGGSELAIMPSYDPETGEITDHASNVGEVFIKTILAGACGGITALVISYFLTGHVWSVVDCITGALGGLVSICSGVAVVPVWAALIIGIIAGGWCILGSKVNVRLQIDDPVDAVAVHLWGGVWGVIAVGIFSRDGSFMTGDGYQMAYQLAGLVVLTLWTFCLMVPFFLLIRWIGWLRISAEQELSGMDKVKHDFGAYSRRFSIAPAELQGDSPTEPAIVSNHLAVVPAEDLKGLPTENVDPRATEVVQQRGSYIDPEAVTEVISHLMQTGKIDLESGTLRKTAAGKSPADLRDAGGNPHLVAAGGSNTGSRRDSGAIELDELAAELPGVVSS